ncbi:aa3-type cytochrome c oxidase subunit IV [Hellea balneolensis]|uniref:aa3-type cytochrome c oxidase subunit IV n=1 Tax=Hellea balneolensis TaxID=287478 RepID=UPI0004095C5C|nr:aa3-type cytochrome c oxidase subunit IV [Hellea balneolensis]
MAAGNSDYERGTMAVDGHKKTFGGFMGTTVYGGAALALIVIFPTLIFGVNMGWPAALVTTLILGVILGIGFKLNGRWYASLIGSAVLLAISSAIIAAFHG